MTLPDATLVIPGHGAETTVAAERENNPYRWAIRTLIFLEWAYILALCKTPHPPTRTPT